MILMKHITTKRQINLKDGTEIPKGTVLEYVRHGIVVSCGVFRMGEREIVMRYRSLVKEPSVATLEKWSENGIAKSVFGAKVEPDGYGQHGEPSWMLAAGLI